MAPLLARLRDAGYVMHAMSNYPEWWRHIEGKLRVSDYLQWSFVSCEGPMKVRRCHVTVVRVIVCCVFCVCVCVCVCVRARGRFGLRTLWWRVPVCFVLSARSLSPRLMNVTLFEVSSPLDQGAASPS